MHGEHVTLSGDVPRWLMRPLANMAAGEALALANTGWGDSRWPYCHREWTYILIMSPN